MHRSEGEPLMLERRRRAVLAISACALAVAVVQHPQADIRILAHDTGDVSPRRFHAALDLGLAGVSVLVTWTAERLR